MTENFEQRINEISKEEINLDMQRTLISEIDEEICILLAERQDATIKVGVYKALHNLESEDKKREQQQNENFKKLATRYHLDSQLLIDIWNNVRKNSKDMHKKIKSLTENN